MPQSFIRHRPLASLIVCACATLSGLATGHADERPLTLPTRDVDVTYAASRLDRNEGAPPLAQRIRWAAAERKLRVDPPGAGIYIVMDYPAHLMSAVRPQQRMVLQLRSDGTGLPLDPAIAASGFVRVGEATILGLPCTDWRTKDSSGEPTTVCLTLDGVMLRARIGDVALVEAVHVAFGPTDSTVFDVPADYRRVVGPEPHP